MNAVVFCGPTLPASLVAEVLPSAEIRAPAACGDIYRILIESSPSVIGLIDGYFDHRLAVWHKEILWALDRGVHVYGAGSMGALRAAELAAFGMIGIGKIYDQFCSRELEDDDEVAIIHESAQRGYAPRSDAMVNLRETLRQAVAAGIIGSVERDTLLAELKRLFYPQRTRQALTRFARELLGRGERDALLSWLDDAGIVDQKRVDALEMLERVSNDMRGGVRDRALGPAWRFEPTNAWQVLRETIERELRETGALAVASNGPISPLHSAKTQQDAQSLDSEACSLLERLRVEMQEEYPAILSEAMERAFALVLAERDGVGIEAQTVQSESERFRLERGLLTPEQTATWLAQYRMSVPDFSALIYDNALCANFAPKIRQATLQQLANVLRNRGISLPP